MTPAANHFWISRRTLLSAIRCSEKLHQPLMVELPRRKTRHKTHLDGFPPTVRILRRRHAWEGRSLELIGWMRRRGRLELIVELPDGSRLLLPAAWTDLKPSAEPAAAGTLGSLDDLLAARRVLEPLLERVVRGQRDDQCRGQWSCSFVWIWRRARRPRRRCGSWSARSIARRRSTLLAALIAQTVAPEAGSDDRVSLRGAGAAGGRDD